MLLGNISIGYKEHISLRAGGLRQCSFNIGFIAFFQITHEEPVNTEHVILNMERGTDPKGFKDPVGPLG